jgi:hypothetical protein
MHRKLIALTTAACAAAAVAVPTAGAQDAPAAPLKIDSAYLYVDSFAPANQRFVRVVFKTAEPLPRRGDGAIRAAGAIDGVNHSLGSAKRGSTCYTAASVIKGGSIATLRDNETGRKGAKIGRTYTVKVTTRDGQSATKRLKLTRERRGDDHGKRLGC